MMHFHCIFIFKFVNIIGKNDGSTFYTLANGIMISVRALERSEEDVFDPIKYIYS